MKIISTYTGNNYITKTSYADGHCIYNVEFEIADTIQSIFSKKVETRRVTDQLQFLTYDEAKYYAENMKAPSSKINCEDSSATSIICHPRNKSKYDEDFDYLAGKYLKKTFFDAYIGQYIGAIINLDNIFNGYVWVTMHESYYSDGKLMFRYISDIGRFVSYEYKKNIINTDFDSLYKHTYDNLYQYLQKELPSLENIEHYGGIKKAIDASITIVSIEEIQEIKNANKLINEIKECEMDKLRRETIDNYIAELQQTILMLSKLKD